MTRDEAIAAVTGPGGPFEITEAVVGGVSMRAYANAPAMNVTSTVSRMSSGSGRRVGCPRSRVVTPKAKHT